MKNTTDNLSVTAEITELPLRLSFWPTLFSDVPDWPLLETTLFTMLSRYCGEYSGGYWEYSTLSNDGAFIYPDLTQGKLNLFNPHNNNTVSLSGEAAGIALCLMLYSLWSFRTKSEVMVEHFYRLRDYALYHAESTEIFRFID